MEEREFAFATSAGAVALAVDKVIDKYHRYLVIDRTLITALSRQADQAIFVARTQSMNTLARANLEELAATFRLIEQPKLDDPTIRIAMAQLREISRQLRENLAQFATDTVDAAPAVTTATIEVQIYVEETAVGPVVESRLRTLLSEAGVVALTGLDPVLGSWYRRLFGTVKDASQTHTAQELRRAAEIQLIDRFQAGIDGATAGAVSSMIAALANTRGAVIQAGSVLLVKVDDKIIVRQLTPEQLLHWNENPGLFRDPAAALTELQRAMAPSVGSHDAGGHEHS